jgi:integrase
MPRKKGRTSTGYSLEERPRASGKPHWRVRIWVNDSDTGKRKTQIVGTFESKTQAQREGARAVEQRERGTLLQPNDTTLSQLLDVWLAQELPKTVAPENRENYRIIIEKHIKPALGSVLVQKLTVQAVEAFYAQLHAARYSSSLIRKCHLRLSSSLEMARRWGWIQVNPCLAARAPKVTSKAPAVWTPQETSAFLHAARDDGMAPYWQLALETGARTSELLGLCWSDFDTARGTLSLGRQAVRLLKGTPIIKAGGKTEAGQRSIRLTEDSIGKLAARRRSQLEQRLAAEQWEDLDLIFSTATGRPINPAHVRRSFNRLVRKSGVRPITPHGMRKTHITNLIAAGANVKAVAARVGHSDVTTTLKTYTALTTSMQEELHALVEGLMTGHTTRGATDG